MYKYFIATITALVGFFSAMLSCHYFLSHKSISAILKPLGLETFSILSHEDMLFPLANTNKIVFYAFGFIFFVFLYAVTMFFPHDKWDEQLKKIENHLKEWIHKKKYNSKIILFLIMIIIPGIIYIGLVLDFSLTLIFLILIFPLLSTHYKKASFIFVIISFFLIVNNFYNRILEKSITQEDLYVTTIKTDDKIITTGKTHKLIFYGSQNIILQNIETGEAEIIPASEIKETKHVKKQGTL